VSQGHTARRALQDAPVLVRYCIVRPRNKMQLDPPPKKKLMQPGPPPKKKILIDASVNCFSK
jgi:hypothetical protein